MDKIDFFGWVFIWTGVFLSLFIVPFLSQYEGQDLISIRDVLIDLRNTVSIVFLFLFALFFSISLVLKMDSILDYLEDLKYKIKKIHKKPEV